MAALTAIFAAIESQMPDDVEVTFDASDEATAKQGRFPRVAVECGTEDFSPPGGAGSAGMPRALWTRRSTVNVHIWGEDRDAAEDLLGHFVAAVHAAALANYTLERGQWLNKSVTRGGVAYVLTMTFRIPITREPEGTVAITAFDPETGELETILTE